MLLGVRKSLSGCEFGYDLFVFLILFLKCVFWIFLGKFEWFIVDIYY